MSETKEKDIIKVSVIISVYNTEHYLEKCLDSLVNQTLEGIEIIAVNNGSTDGSAAILDRYQSEYPDIFHVITIAKNTGDPAEPWNLGISEAKGEYISIVDSDDWCSTSMFELLYLSGEKYNSEMVLCDNYEYFGKDNVIESHLNANAGEFDLQQLMLYPHMAPWGKIVKKSVYTENHLKYKSQIHCDTGLNLVMYSYLSRVSYVNEPLYYYNRTNPSSETNTKKRMRQAGIVNTLNHILEGYNKRWEDEVVFTVVRFLYWFCFTEYIFHQDIFIPFVKEHEREIRRNKYLRANKEGLRVVFNYLDQEMVPKRIVYGCFGRELTEMEKQCVKSWKKYTVDYAFIELNEDNCNLDENPFIAEAYEQGDFQKVTQYFTLKDIYKNGGITLSPSMEMTGPIGEMRMHKFAAGFISQHVVGDEVIAATPHSPLVRRICEALGSSEEFDEDEEDDEKVSTVSKCIHEYILSHNYPLSNQNMLLPGDVMIFSSDRVYYEINQINILQKNYSEIYNLCHKPFVALHEDAIKSYTEYINLLEAQNRALSAQLQSVTGSRSWRYLEPIRKLIRGLRSVKVKIMKLTGRKTADVISKKKAIV